MTILKLFVLIITVAHIHLASTRRSPSHHKKSPEVTPEGETLIENKNVNVVVNVDPKEVATELWKIIVKEHPLLQQSAGARAYMHELEEIIKPYLTPTRRSEPSAYEVANNLDFITRRVLSNQSQGIDPAEEESKTRNIVSVMMKKLKNIREDGQKMMANDKSSDKPSEQLGDTQPGRRSMSKGHAKKTKLKVHKKKNDDLDLLIRIRKGKVMDATLV